MRTSIVVITAFFFVLINAGRASGAGMPANSSSTAPKTAPSSVLDNEQIMKPLTGTLFFSPEQRTKMDRQRKNPMPMIAGVAAAPVSSIVNGFVKRSDGQSAVWVDGEPRYNVNSSNMIRLQPTDVGGAGESVLLSPTGETFKSPVPNKVRAKKSSVKKATRVRATKKR